MNKDTHNILFTTLMHTCISGLKMMNFRFITVIFFLLFVSFAYGQNEMHIIDSILTSVHNEGKINGNVLLAEKGQIVYLKSFGLANEATKEKLNENSVFGLGSVTKQFTAMAIVMLKEQGNLNYDDKITKYLPELTAYDNISVRNLLNHTSGLPDITQLQNTPEAKEFVSRLKGNVSFSSMKEIFKSAVLKDSTTTTCGFGWFISEDTISGKSVSHTGGDRGYSTYIERNIDNDRTIIILQNHSPVMMPVYILKHYFYNIPYPNEIKLSQQQLDALSGTYEIQKGFNFRIWSENGRIKSQAAGPEIIELFAENELLLYAKEMDAQVQFEKDKKGRITCLYILQNGNKIKAKKKY